MSHLGGNRAVLNPATLAGLRWSLGRRGNNGVTPALIPAFSPGRGGNGCRLVRESRGWSGRTGGRIEAERARWNPLLGERIQVRAGVAPIHSPRKPKLEIRSKQLECPMGGQGDCICARSIGNVRKFPVRAGFPRGRGKLRPGRARSPNNSGFGFKCSRPPWHTNRPWQGAGNGNLCKSR